MYSLHAAVLRESSYVYKLGKRPKKWKNAERIPSNLEFIPNGIRRSFSASRIWGVTRKVSTAMLRNFSNPLNSSAESRKYVSKQASPKTPK
jgi:hypothetical protein